MHVHDNMLTDILQIHDIIKLHFGVNIMHHDNSVQARSKQKWSGRAKHCMAQLKVCASTVLLGGSGGMPPQENLQIRCPEIASQAIWVQK